MIQMKHLISAILFCSTLSLSAIDMNNSAEIIKEAEKATEGLQKDFSQLLETEEATPQETNTTTIDHNVTAKEVIIVEKSDEEIDIEEQNVTAKEVIIIENIATKELNITTKKVLVIEESVKNIAIKEHNETVKKPIIIKNKFEEPTKVVIVETNKTSIINDTLTDTNTTILENNITTLRENNLTLEENQTVAQVTITEEEEGSFTKGMVIFKSKLKTVCKMTGEEFAKNYTQEDWDDIYDNDEFEKVVYEICPDMKEKYDKKWTNDLYQFSLKYASDSDEIPEC